MTTDDWITNPPSAAALRAMYPGRVDPAVLTAEGKVDPARLTASSRLDPTLLDDDDPVRDAVLQLSVIDWARAFDGDRSRTPEERAAYDEAHASEDAPSFVAQARAAGIPWGMIGRTFGLSAKAARMRWGRKIARRSAPGRISGRGLGEPRATPP